MSGDLAGCLPAGQFGEIISLQEMASGLSGAVVRTVTTTSGRYVLRVYPGDSESWDRTLAIHRVVAGRGIAPSLLHVDQERRCTVSQWINDASFVAAMGRPASREAALTSLVAALSTLHSLPVPARGESSTLQFAREIWDSQSRRAGFPAWALALATRLQAVEAHLAQDDRSVLSHGDLNPSNILWDGARVWLIDWDGAGPAHPYLDLAGLSNFLGLPDEAAMALIAMQEQARPGEGEGETFRACRDLARITYGCVFLRLNPDLTCATFKSAASTATLPECFAGLVEGHLSLANADGQAAVGAAFFKQCLQPGAA
jgi:aminoglycoside phosphotransferase (APT) family kinase protein